MHLKGEMPFKMHKIEMPFKLHKIERRSEKRVLKAFQQLLHKRHKMTKFRMLLYNHENVVIAGCQQGSKCF